MRGEKFRWSSQHRKRRGQESGVLISGGSRADAVIPHAAWIPSTPSVPHTTHLQHPSRLIIAVYGVQRGLETNSQRCVGLVHGQCSRQPTDCFASLSNQGAGTWSLLGAQHQEVRIQTCACVAGLASLHARLPLLSQRTEPRWSAALPHATACKPDRPAVTRA